MKKTATPSFPMNFTFFDMLELFCYINNIPYGCMFWIKRKRWNKWHKLQNIFIYENPHMYLEQLKLNEIWKKHVIYLCSKCHCNEPIDANYCKRISLSNGEKTKNIVKLFHFSILHCKRICLDILSFSIRGVFYFKITAVMLKLLNRFINSIYFSQLNLILILK